MENNTSKEIKINEKRNDLDYLMDNIFSDLPKNEQDIIKKRFGITDRKHTLEEIGQEYGVTRERIRQIENAVIKKIITINKKNETLIKLKNSIIEFVKEYGGFAEECFLIDKYFESLNENEKKFVEFLLSKIFADELVQYKTKNNKIYYRLKEVTTESLDKVLNEVNKVLEDIKEPLQFDDIFERLKMSGVVDDVSRKLQAFVSESREDTQEFFRKVLESYLNVSDTIKKNVVGLWGIGEWKTISPKRVTDKIYIVLKKAGKPLHFKEITRLINESKFDKKPARDVTIHNELILDDRYVLVGRGIYALKEWGYKRGNVGDIIYEILSRGKPLTKKEIFDEVSKQKIVKESTIYLALTNDKRFRKTSDNKYELAK
ncbi:MAG TPA: sigma factor-like helix-turn-helix DNA-binding protein [bacterium]|nr:hypothetical protein [Patescibacteria group bacterium]HOC96575.1 sigma factor-like helix-turn-helix DNA-binding protein [bacterium]HPO11382.1 sigma factor-like helix-turn-helix DNA-binding protein [bacterium]HQL11820.1 sigma factor-like helix-turn-helix DNA-binding protein [bacterium]